MDKNIVLIGFMGSGKSMIAQQLADILKVEKVSTDELIIKEAGKSIDDIFKTYGEPYFRNMEARIIKEVSCRRGIIIDCGGGVVLRAESLPNLKHNGIVFFLHATPETVYDRIKNDKHRPLLNIADPLGFAKQLYNQRLPLYQQADYTIDSNDESIEGPVAEILKIIK